MSFTLTPKSDMQMETVGRLIGGLGAPECGRGCAVAGCLIGVPQETKGPKIIKAMRFYRKFSSAFLSIVLVT